MTDIQSAVLSAKVIWSHRPPWLPEKERQQKLPFPISHEEKKRQIRDIGISAVILWILGYSVFLTIQARGHPGEHIEYTVRVLAHALSPPWIFASPLVLLGTIVALTNVRARFPHLNVSPMQLWRKPGQERVNVVLKPTQLPYVGLALTAVLILLVPTFASWEEFLFRDQDFVSSYPLVGGLFASMPEMVFIFVWSILGFGLIHILSGVDLSEALVLGLVGGLYFALVYRYWGGLPSAIIAHTSYNILAIGFMISPEMQTLVSRLFQTASMAINPENS